MRTLISIDDYREPETLVIEQQSLFRRLWQFAGFARDIATDGDYLVADAGGKSVIVQNFDGELRAFLNVCSHRFSAIRGDCRGNGPLQCQYHGWVYDREGIPVGIADFKEFEDITEERRRELALKKWDVETCGEFVFVRESQAAAPSLRNWLAGSWQTVEAFGSALGEMIDRNQMVIDANWKVAVENTLESYHVRSVHPNSFARLNARTAGFRVDGPHSSWQATIEAVMEKQLRKVIRLIGITTNFEGYFHHLVFPALTLATTMGMSYAVQSFRPVSVDRTEFTSYVFMARDNGTAGNPDLLREACRPAVDFNRSVFEEDRIVCGQAQAGIRQAPAAMTGELSREEQRVAHFQKAWKELMMAPGAESAVH